MTAGTDRRFRLGVGVATFVVLAAAWAAGSAQQWIPSIYFPPPGEVWAALRQVVVQGYADGRLHQHFFHSCLLVLYGFVAAVAIGVPLGMAMGASRRAEALLNPAFLLIRPIPPLAWIPLAIVWLGLGDGAKVLVIWFAAFVPSVINSYAGVRSIEPHLIEAARGGNQMAAKRFSREFLHDSAAVPLLKRYGKSNTPVVVFENVIQVPGKGFRPRGQHMTHYFDEALDRYLRAYRALHPGTP